MEALWAALDNTQEVMDELSAYFVEQNDFASQDLITKESNELEAECRKAIEQAQCVVVNSVSQSKVASMDGEQNTQEAVTVTESGVETAQGIDTGGASAPQTPGVLGSGTNLSGSNGSVPQDQGIPVEQAVVSTQVLDEQSNNVQNDSIPATAPSSQEGSTESSGNNQAQVNHRLKPLKVPTCNGDKREFEGYWGLFESLVDASNESIGQKMARPRQSLSGIALESIRGLGISEPEYEEAKEILKMKFGGQRRQLRAYMDDLERMSPLQPTDIRSFERFADLVRVTVVKLQAEGKRGELGDGTLYSLLVKKLTENQLESYTRWMNEQRKEKSVLSLRDWLKKEVSIRVEAIEMSRGIEPDRKQFLKKNEGKVTSRSFFNAAGKREQAERDGGHRIQQKPPCAFCNGLYHGIWTCRKFEQKTVEERWDFAKENQLCFRCLSKDHKGKECRRAQPCKVGGCKLNHHVLLHRQPIKYPPQQQTPYNSPREGAPENSARTTTSQNQANPSGQFSLRTIPVWLKANGKKLKVNAILDDASNETFLNQDVANLLGIQETFQTVQVNVLNNSVETFQSMPAKIELESIGGEFGKVIEVKTCPNQVTGTYRVEDWNEMKKTWPHLQQCEFPSPAKDGFVDLLIGIDKTDLHYSKVDLQGPPGAPIARLGPLGWTCVGQTGRQMGTRSHLIVHSFLTREAHMQDEAFGCCEVNDTLRRFWEVESYGTGMKRSDVMTKEEKFALEKVESTLTHDGNRYRLAVPWKEDCPELNQL